MAHLDPRHIETIVGLLQQHPSVEKATVFGSRALGTAKEGSDVDLALFGNVDARTLGRIRNALEDTTIPYFFDVVVYGDIDHPELRKHIDEHGVTLFEQTKTPS